MPPSKPDKLNSCQSVRIFQADNIFYLKPVEAEYCNDQLEKDGLQRCHPRLTPFGHPSTAQEHWQRALDFVHFRDCIYGLDEN